VSRHGMYHVMVCITSRYVLRRGICHVVVCVMSWYMSRCCMCYVMVCVRLSRIVLQHFYWGQFVNNIWINIYQRIIHRTAITLTETSPPPLPLPSEACIDTSCDSGTSTLQPYYSNFNARQLYTQKCLKYRKSQYCLPEELISAMTYTD